jgi:hypothetical protein
MTLTPLLVHAPLLFARNQDQTSRFLALEIWELQSLRLGP